MKQSGQVIIILLLIMVVSLGVALALIGRSNTEVSTAARTEASTRAFSAAEAGIESALYNNNTSVGIGTTAPPSFNLGSQGQAAVTVDSAPNMPPLGKALEYPPIDKGSFAQFWLADPNNMVYGTGACTQQQFPGPSYNTGSFTLYFGATNDQNSQAGADYLQDMTNSTSIYIPAISLNVVYRSGCNYLMAKYLIDAYPRSGSDSNRAGNGFSTPSCDTVNSSGSFSYNTTQAVTTNNNTSSTNFYCYFTVTGSTSPTAPNGGAETSNYGYNSATMYPVLAVARILYSNISHPVAIAPASGNSLPYQASVFTSTAAVGDVQRKIQVFREVKVMPEIFNFALFSAGTLDKQGN